MSYTSVNSAQKFSLSDEQWAPKVVAEMNNHQFLFENAQGDFAWHAHADTDEVFISVDGMLRIGFLNGAVTIGTDGMSVVPKVTEGWTYR